MRERDLERWIVAVIESRHFLLWMHEVGHGREANAPSNVEEDNRLSAGHAESASAVSDLHRGDRLRKSQLSRLSEAPEVPPPDDALIARADSNIAVLGVPDNTPDVALVGLALIALGFPLTDEVQRVGLGPGKIEDPELLLLTTCEEVCAGRRRGRREGNGADNMVVGERVKDLAGESVPNLAGWGMAS